MQTSLPSRSLPTWGRPVSPSRICKTAKGGRSFVSVCPQADLVGSLPSAQALLLGCWSMNETQSRAGVELGWWMALMVGRMQTPRLAWPSSCSKPRRSDNRVKPEMGRGRGAASVAVLAGGCFFSWSIKVKQGIEVKQRSSQFSAVTSAAYVIRPVVSPRP
ncbi:hypothetical protein GGTG_12803 [Gaeumannomyces tritici R3-111a-1]|uniref:Uncharacterized protein n=1 Tax=Gaeumannomyces tritici (strain R3-111a-1) TaxID=644352 RepID=J3PH23_GAET3|nr:hypothetical protein GGTG_12803 [Gaeumannomyces tritici R3-111a-1]EJT69920.1 hypothetical protein GGTG_12803 [Gaeumannomyces tritici R3-111a-1]